MKQGKHAISNTLLAILNAFKQEKSIRLIRIDEEDGDIVFWENPENQ